MASAVLHQKWPQVDVQLSRVRGRGIWGTGHHPQECETTHWLACDHSQLSHAGTQKIGEMRLEGRLGEILVALMGQVICGEEKINTESWLALSSTVRGTRPIIYRDGLWSLPPQTSGGVEGFPPPLDP